MTDLEYGQPAARRSSECPAGKGWGSLGLACLCHVYTHIHMLCVYMCMRISVVPAALPKEQRGLFTVPSAPKATVNPILIVILFSF